MRKRLLLFFLVEILCVIIYSYTNAANSISCNQIFIARFPQNQIRIIQSVPYEQKQVNASLLFKDKDEALALIYPQFMSSTNGKNLYWKARGEISVVRQKISDGNLFELTIPLKEELRNSEIDAISDDGVLISLKLFNGTRNVYYLFNTFFMDIVRAFHDDKQIYLLKGGIFATLSTTPNAVSSLEIYDSNGMSADSISLHDIFDFNQQSPFMNAKLNVFITEDLLNLVTFIVRDNLRPTLSMYLNQQMKFFNHFVANFQEGRNLYFDKIQFEDSLPSEPQMYALTNIKNENIGVVYQLINYAQFENMFTFFTSENFIENFSVSPGQNQIAIMQDTLKIYELTGIKWKLKASILLVDLSIKMKNWTNPKILNLGWYSENNLWVFTNTGERILISVP